jgi:opacity protein-like surface antigen
MKYKFRGKVLIILTITSLLILPSIVRAEKQKIRVIFENASIRIKPDMEGEIIESPPIDSLLVVEKKVGDWYEIRFPSKVGVLITGYIHEMFVEVEKEVPVPKREVIPKPSRPEIPRRHKIANIKLGGLYYRVQAGYDYEFSISYLDEILTITDEVANEFAFGFDVGFGVFLIENIEITGSVNYLSKSLTGDYSISLPNAILYDDIAYDEISASPTLREIIFSFGVNFHPVTTGKIRPYFGGGGSYIMGKMDLVEDLEYEETIYGNLTHTIEITKVVFEETTINKFGFNLTAGINYEVRENIFVFAEGKYIIAKKEVPHPMTSEFVEGETLEIDLGGLSFILGIKLLF